MDGVAVHDGVHLLPRPVQTQVEKKLRRGGMRTVLLVAISVHDADVVRFQARVGTARWGDGDQELIRRQANAQVATGPAYKTQAG